MAIDKDELERKQKLSFMLQKQDQELIKQHKWEMSNICPRCFVVLTKNKKCSMGCDD